MADSSLLAIKNKVRRLTSKPSPSQLSDADLLQYINTFILYDLPEHLRLFNLRTNLIFYTTPFVGTYGESTDVNSPLYDFNNRYTGVYNPMYISGQQVNLMQDQTQFYAIWQKNNFSDNTRLVGNGTNGPFTTILAYTNIQQNSFTLNCYDTSGNEMILVDYPISNTTGALGLVGQPQTLPSPYGQINYLTGSFTANFPNITQPQAIIWANYIPYVAGIPTTVLYYDQKFTIRPIPDKVYPVEVQVDILPTELLLNTDNPDLKAWWQYIAFGTAIKILNDEKDLDSIQLISPGFIEQQDLVFRRTIAQYGKNPVYTIYNTPGNLGGGGWGWGYNNNPI